MTDELCIECKERPILVKKRHLCQRCYQNFRNSNRGLSIISPNHEFMVQTEEKKEHQGEIDFIKNFFKHKNWIHQPGLFRLDGVNYSPDFYDVERNIFIEVSATRQAYFFNKEKYQALRKLFPKLGFEIRKPSGELLNEDGPIYPQLLEQ